MSTMPKYAMTYVVAWPDALGPGRHVFKIGRAWKFHRVQLMVRTGAQVLILARNTDATWEREALRIMTRWFPKAFNHAWESEGLLFMGRGWTECFEVADHYVDLAVDLIFKGFARGNDQGVNEATDDQCSRPAVGGVHESADGGETHSDGPVGAHRRVRQTPPDTGVDSSGPVPGPARHGHGDGSPAAARRGRVPDDLPIRGGRVHPTDQAPESRPEGRDTRLSGTAPRSSMEFHGCGGRGRACGCGRAGEREREGAGEGAGRSERACTGLGGLGRTPRGCTRPTGPAVAGGCATDRLPGASQRPIRELWPLRHRPPSSRQVRSRDPLHGAVREVLRGRGDGRSRTRHRLVNEAVP